MHPEIALHMRGMWIAFALAALIIAILVTRLTMAVERSDRALEALRDRGARASRLAGLTTAVAGAAHELSTPLATIAVAARELERATGHAMGDGEIARDARLIRLEIDRCRSILDQMAGQFAEPMGEAPQTATAGATIAAALERLNASERARIRAAPGPEIAVVWPAGVVAQAVGNLLKNALQSSMAGDVDVDAALLSGDRVRLLIRDRGQGMSPEVLARAGEPFFTTKPSGSGTGLGVFVARSAVEQLGGEFTLSSTLGEGTTAEIRLPRDVTSRLEARHE
jgi:two-component system sensor histidine kinase RegB